MKGLVFASTNASPASSEADHYRDIVSSVQEEKFSVGILLEVSIQKRKRERLLTLLLSSRIARDLYLG